MSDSFFTARNHFDEQIERDQFSDGSCEGLVEAAVRRMVKLNGPHQAAVRIQRVADICGGVHVLPIEHWRRAEKVQTAPAVQAPKPNRRLLAIFHSVSWSYWIGLAVGFFIGVQSR